MRHRPSSTRDGGRRETLPARSRRRDGLAQIAGGQPRPARRQVSGQLLAEGIVTVAGRPAGYPDMRLLVLGGTPPAAPPPPPRGPAPGPWTRGQRGGAGAGGGGGRRPGGTGPPGGGCSGAARGGGAGSRGGWGKGGGGPPGGPRRWTVSCG